MARLMFDKSDTGKAPDKDRKRPVDMTGDEIMDELFDPKVRNELKKLAHENRPKEKKSKTTK